MVFTAWLTCMDGLTTWSLIPQFKDVCQKGMMEVEVCVCAFLTSTPVSIRLITMGIFGNRAHCSRYSQESVYCSVLLEAKDHYRDLWTPFQKFLHVDDLLLLASLLAGGAKALFSNTKEGLQ